MSENSSENTSKSKEDILSLAQIEKNRKKIEDLEEQNSSINEINKTNEDLRNNLKTSINKQKDLEDKTSSIEAQTSSNNKEIARIKDSITILNLEEIEIKRKVIDNIGSKSFLPRISYFFKTYFIPVTLVLIAVVQTYLLRNQNKTIRKQGEIQRLIVDNERKSTYKKHLFEIMNRIEDAFTTSKNINTNNKLELSQGSIDLIVSYADMIQPSFEEIIDSKDLDTISRERGELLAFLLRSDLSIRSKQEIFKRGNFDFAFIDNCRIENQIFEGIDLKKITCKSMSFINCDLKFCNFIGSKISRIRFVNCEVDELTFDAVKTNSLCSEYSNLKALKIYNSKIDSISTSYCDLQYFTSQNFINTSSMIRVWDFFNMNIPQSNNFDSKHISKLMFERCDLQMNAEYFDNCKDDFNFSASNCIVRTDVYLKNECLNKMKLKNTACKFDDTYIGNYINLDADFKLVSPSTRGGDLKTIKEFKESIILN